MNLAAPRAFSELVGYTPRPYDEEKEIHGTTVLAIRYQGGVLTFADRRATIGNLIMFDQAEKVFRLDSSTVVAISGSFARSVEICRLLQHSFKYYRRMQLAEMSREGKLQEISRALSQNLGMAMNGIGVFVPIVASYDKTRGEFGVYFFDTAGARFQNGVHATAGSGSERIRGIFEYVQRTGKPFAERTRKEVLVEGLRMLDIAASLDSATGGITKHPPVVNDLTANGNQMLKESELTAALKVARG